MECFVSGAEEKEEKVRREKKELSPEEFEKGRQDIIFAVNSARQKKLQDKVAWILNHYPASRDSDITLSLKFWEQFEAEFLDGDVIKKQNLFKLTKTNSLTRERARIQNDYKLYLASDSVRKHRGKLEEDQYETAISEQPSYPVSVVYADESGKNDKFLVVGSLWILNGYETVRLQKKIEEWKKIKGINYEFHYSELKKQQLNEYKELVDLLYEESGLLGFKGMFVEREGTEHQSKVFGDLFYHLIIRGIEHDHETSRAPLPRTLQFLKDQESVGGDKILMANLRDRLQLASLSKFDKKLYIDQIEASDSKALIHLQLTDLFTGSMNRHLNHNTGVNNHKDEFAEYFMNKFNIKKKRIAGEDVTALLTIS